MFFFTKKKKRKKTNLGDSHFPKGEQEAKCVRAGALLLFWFTGLYLRASVEVFPPRGGSSLFTLYNFSKKKVFPPNTKKNQ